MKTIKIIMAMALTCLLCASSCKDQNNKNEDVWTELPPATQHKANTIGCLVDGKLWAARKKFDISKFPAFRATYSDQGYGEVHLNFYASDNVGGIGFEVVNPKLGMNVAKINCRFDVVARCTVRRDTIYTLNLTKLDLEKGILSGLFEFSLPCKEDPNKILHITEGRFDLYMTVL